MHNKGEGHTFFFQTSESHLKILGARRVVWSKLRTEGPQMLDTAVKKISHPGETRRLEYVQPVLKGV
jgi:hypothetical protein